IAVRAVAKEMLPLRPFDLEAEVRVHLDRRHVLDVDAEIDLVQIQPFERVREDQGHRLFAVPPPPAGAVAEHDAEVRTTMQRVNAVELDVADVGPGLLLDDGEHDRPGRVSDPVDIALEGRARRRGRAGLEKARHLVVVEPVEVWSLDIGDLDRTQKDLFTHEERLAHRLPQTHTLPSDASRAASASSKTRAAPSASRNGVSHPSMHARKCRSSARYISLPS